MFQRLQKLHFFYNLLPLLQKLHNSTVFMKMVWQLNPRYKNHIKANSKTVAVQCFVTLTVIEKCRQWSELASWTLVVMSDTNYIWPSASENNATWQKLYQ